MRHKSFDIHLSMKELERFDDKSTDRYEVYREDECEGRKQKGDRKCHSQQKSYDLERVYYHRNSLKTKNGNFTSLSKSMKRNPSRLRNESPLRIKRSDKSLKSIEKKSSKKNL